MSILRDTLVKKAVAFMATNDALDTIVTAMNEHRIDPYSAVEEIVSKMMPV